VIGCKLLSDDEGRERRRPQSRVRERRHERRETETNEVKFPVLNVGGTTGRGVVRESSRTLKSPALFERMSS